MGQVACIPETMSRSDAWRFAYKRKPYLAHLTDQRLKVYFNRCVAVNSLSFVKGSWPKPAPEQTAAGMEVFTHAIEEINRRGLDMRAFSPQLLSQEELREVYQGLPDEFHSRSPKGDDDGI